MGRRLRTRLDDLFPDLGQTVKTQQARQKASHDRGCRERSLKPGDPVYVTSRMGGWLTGDITTQTGPLSFTVRMEDGRAIKRHADHLRFRKDASTPGGVTQAVDTPCELAPPRTEMVCEALPTAPGPTLVDDAEETVGRPDTLPTPRRSGRVCRPPRRFRWD